MQISKKKENQIAEIGSIVLREILIEYKPRYYKDNWFDAAPEEWNDDEKNYFDSLSEMELRITSRVIEII